MDDEHPIQVAMRTIDTGLDGLAFGIGLLDRPARRTDDEAEEHIVRVAELVETMKAALAELGAELGRFYAEGDG